MNIDRPDPFRSDGAAEGSDEAHAPAGEMGQVFSRREREKRQCKKEILAAASELFAQLGYDKTGMKQIAEKVGVSVGALYSHFPGKEDILRELLMESIQELQRKGDAACRPDDPPMAQLRSRMAASLGHFREHMDFMMIFHNESPHSLEGMVRAELARNIELAAGLLDRAMARGDIPRSDPKALAAVLVGAFHELMRMFADRGVRNRFDEITGIIDELILKPLEMKKRVQSGMEGS